MTKSRLVHDIDSALDLQNYDRFDIPETEKKIIGVIKEKNSTKEIHFTNNPQNVLNVGHASRHIIRGPLGLKNAASKAKAEIDHFLLFITHEILADVLHHTNKKIDSLLAKLPADFNKDVKYSFVKEVSEMELKAFIGLFLYRGLYKLNTVAIRKLFSDSYVPPMFSVVMSRNRFIFILHNLPFDDESTHAERWKKDRFTAFCEFFEKLNNQCMLVLAPVDYLSLDETLYPMRTQISFKQFNPSKPVKYGLLFKSVNVARYPYTFISSPYSGKPTEEGGQYYVQGTEAIVHYLTETLSTNSSSAGGNISFDQLYISIPLAKWLLEKRITCIGTMKLNRKSIPDKLKETKNRELLSSEIYWNKN